MPVASCQRPHNPLRGIETYCPIGYSPFKYSCQRPHNPLRGIETQLCKSYCNQSYHVRDPIILFGGLKHCSQAVFESNDVSQRPHNPLRGIETDVFLTFSYGLFILRACRLNKTISFSFICPSGAMAAQPTCNR